DAHTGPQRADQVLGAVGARGRPEQHLFQAAVDADLDAGAAWERAVRRRHAPVVAAPGRFAGLGERRAEHHSIGAARDRLADVAAGPHAAVGDDLDVAAGLAEVQVPR